MDAPAHWAGTEPVRILRPTAPPSAIPTSASRRSSCASSCGGWSSPGGSTASASPSSARASSRSIPGSRARRPRRSGSRSPSAPRTWSSRPSASSPSRSSAGVDPVQYLWYHRGTWHGGPVRPARDPVRADLHPDRDADLPRGRLRAGTAAGRRRRVRARLLRRRARRARATSTKAANLAAVFGACRRSCSARTTAGRSACRPGSRRRVRSGGGRRGYGFPGVRVDGNDVLAVLPGDDARRSSAHARGDGPTLIEALTYRMGAHSTADDASRYRDEAEVERWRAFDPIDAVPERGCSRPATRTRTSCATCDEEAEALALGGAGRRSRRPGAAGRVDVRLGVRGTAGRPARQREEALGWLSGRCARRSTARCSTRWRRIHGCSCSARTSGGSGGVFRVTDGLQAEFGEARVFDTPISEAGIAGAAVGLCFAGWRPVVEMQFDAFCYPALEQM